MRENFRVSEVVSSCYTCKHRAETSSTDVCRIRSLSPIKGWNGEIKNTAKIPNACPLPKVDRSIASIYDAKVSIRPDSGRRQSCVADVAKRLRSQVENSGNVTQVHIPVTKYTGSRNVQRTVTLSADSIDTIEQNANFLKVRFRVPKARGNDDKYSLKFSRQHPPTLHKHEGEFGWGSWHQIDLDKK